MDKFLKVLGSVLSILMFISGTYFLIHGAWIETDKTRSLVEMILGLVVYIYVDVQPKE